MTAEIMAGWQRDAEGGLPAEFGGDLLRRAFDRLIELDRAGRSGVLVATIRALSPDAKSTALVWLVSHVARGGTLGDEPGEGDGGGD
jgi:hypothetical protein